MSKVDPWQGQRNPPRQSSGSDGWGPAANLSPGEQPRCEQIPTTTRYSGLIERHSLRAYAGVSSSGLRSDFGSASAGSFFASASSCALVRRTIHTGLPRHSTVIFSPGASAPMSTSTGAPAASARPAGATAEPNRTTAATPPSAPTPVVSATQVRRPGSAGVSPKEASLID